MDEQTYNLFTRGQKAAYTAIIRGYDVFLTGCGGTGKSWITNVIIKKLIEIGKSVIVCAPTGVAAENIGGATIHRVFPLDKDFQFTQNGRLRRSIPAVIRKADVIIIDEISMVRADIFDCVMSSIKTASIETGRHKQIIVCGDFLQLPPVMRKGDAEALEKFYGRSMPIAWAFLGDMWNRIGFKTIILNEVLRQNDSEMLSNLNLCRLGDRTCINYFNENTAPQRTTRDIHLYAHKKDVDRENNRNMNQLAGEEYRIPRVIKGNLLQSELMDANGDVEDKDLVLKNGARVMITKNIYIQDGRKSTKPICVNGTVGIVKGVCFDPEDPMNDYVIVQTEKTKQKIDIYRQKRKIYGYTESKNKTVKIPVGSIAEFPLVPAYAMTIHKAQGQTYEWVNINPRGCFAPGQLYVALSRAKTVGGIYLDYKLLPSDLIIDSNVQDFYAKLHDDTDEFAVNKRGRPSKPKHEDEKQPRKSTSEKGGRPGRFGVGEERRPVQIKAPKEVADVLQRILDEAFPASQTKPDMKKYSRLIKHLATYYKVNNSEQETADDE